MTAMASGHRRVPPTVDIPRSWVENLECGFVGDPCNGVPLSVARTDGKPAFNADGTMPADQVADAAGDYHFTGLAVLPRA